MGLFDALGGLFAPNFAGPADATLQNAYQNIIQPSLQGGLTNVGQLYGQAIPFVQQQTAQALPYLQSVYGAGQQGVNQLMSLLGIGPGGVAAANQAFQATPGYSDTLKAANDATAAQAAATGKLASGAETNAAQQNAARIANQYYQSAVSNLSPFTNMFTQGATGVGNLFSNLGSGVANLFAGQAQQASPFYQSMANAGQWLGGTQANLGAQQSMLDAALGSNLLGGLLNFGASSGGAGLLKSIGGGIGSLFGLSDARLKEDIKPVGKLFDDTRVYSFRYKGEPGTHIGVMAQEVEQRTPDAVREFGGVKFVDYERATRPAAALAYLMAA